ncbi:beta strand repeat-containing protein, partial [Flavobacterium facile]|uniref:beta strand repeat-containing protein n=1 Tax=Flavobacterium facile TaxID=2893174 RepID=UPI002E7808F2
MGKFYKIIILSCFFALTSFNLYSQQINFIRFNNSASYTSGSGVSVIINPTGVFDLNNQFVLELSNPGGAFTSPTVLNTLNEFYVPVINGVLPNGLAAGTYKLRVRSTNPVLEIITDPFTVISGGGIGVPNFQSTLLNVGSSTFNCLSSCTQLNNIFGKIDAATGELSSIISSSERRGVICNYDSNLSYQINLINISNSTITNLPINNSNGQFVIPDNLPIGTYGIEIEKKQSNNLSIFTNIFIFHGSATTLSNSTGETVCIGNNVNFSIAADANGILRNYMGSKYTITFGDGTNIETYTHAQLLNLYANNLTIPHRFNDVSCNTGTAPNSGYFIVKLNLLNKGVFNSGINLNYCNEYYKNGNGIEKQVNTSRAPVANFTLPAKQCVNTSITATNTTTLGQYGTSICLTTPKYTWSVKRPNDTDYNIIDTFFNPSWLVGNNLVIPASAVNIVGCWQIKLQAKNEAGCITTTEMIKTIKIEATPTPSFTNSPQSPICAGTSVLFTNTSNVLNITCQEPVYSWTVTPVSGTPATSTGYQFIAPSTASSPNANILFTQPGSYSVVLNVTNSCGTFASTPRIIEVFGDPTVSFNPNTLTICDAAPAGHTINFNQVSTTPTYSVAPYAPTNFTWTVSGPGVTPADYSFVGGTNANSQYPQINFTAYKTYIITVQVNGNCAGSNQASFTFILKEMPAISNSNLTQTICTGGTTSPINLTSSMASGTIFNWFVTATNGITGFTTPGNSTVIPANTLINPSNTFGTVTYTVTPSNNGCVGTPVNFVITVNPAPLVPTQTFIACSGNAFTVSLSNTPPSVIIPLGTTFTWTVSSPVGITGASNQTTPVSSIGQTLVNTTNAPIDVIYTITASTGTAPSTCTSNFTLTVTVNPRPQIPNQTSSICSGNAFNLSLSNNPPSIILPSGTTYTWTVSAPAGITGASNQINPVNIIGQTLLNSTSNPINVIYTITATSGVGINTCTSNFNLTVTVNPAPSATISGNASICQNSNAAVITFTGLNGVAPYTFTYSINGGSNQTISTTSGSSVTLIAPTSTLGTFNYCLLGVVDSSTSSCLNTSNSCVAIIVNSLPTISTQPTTTQSICVGGTIAPLNVAYTGGVGTATYQWYSITTNSNSGGTLIAGATNSSYTPAAFTSAGTYYYYATITLSGNGCGSTTSNTAEVVVVTDPIITTQAIATQTLCQSSTPTNLTISVSGGIGTISYQWYSNTTNSNTGGTIIASATNSTYTPPTTTVGTRYYYCIVTQSGVGCSVTSAVSQVIIVAAPAITTQPASSSVCENGTPTQLTVAYTNGTGTPTYQWFSNTTNSTIGGTAISGATSASYSPPSTTVGTLYYY